MTRTRIVLADDHELVLEGLKALLDSEEDMEVVATATNGHGLLDAVRRRRPDVAVLDLEMGEPDGLACLDAKTGQGYWTYDMLAAAWGSPLIVDGHVYIGDEDGDVCIFKHSKDPQEDPLAEINMGNSVYSTPIVANGVLYIANRTHLFAIQAPQEAE